MTTVTFTLDQNNNLVGIDNATGFPQSIPLTLEGLKKVQTILHKTDQKLIEEYNRQKGIVLFERSQMLQQMEEEREHRQMKELEELF